MSGFNARTRYLRGLAGLGITPSQAFRKQRLLAGFNPRARYLRGLGDDDITSADLYELSNPSGPNDVYGEAGPSQTTSLISAETGLPPGIYSASSMPGSVALLPGLSTPTTLFQTPSTAASIANAPATSWITQTNPTLGISNGMLLGGLGLVAAVVLLGGSGSGRR